MRDKQYLLLIVMVVILLVGFFSNIVTGVIKHEHAHKAISNMHGCVDSEIKYYITLTEFKGVFMCNKHTERTDAIIQQEKLLHSYNEIVSYNNQKVVNSIFVLSSLIVLITMFFYRREWNGKICSSKRK